MDEVYLYDLPREYYQNAVVTDGAFDAEKAAALGYSDAQFAAIEEFLGLAKAEPPDEDAGEE